MYLTYIPTFLSAGGGYNEDQRREGAGERSETNAPGWAGRWGNYYCYKPIYCNGTWNPLGMKYVPEGDNLYWDLDFILFYMIN